MVIEKPLLIDYIKLGQAIEFYTSQGFTYIEVPWGVSYPALALTAPPGSILYPLDSTYLVASAEQSFLQWILQGDLPRGKYVACTPCFRGDKLTEFNRRYFMKVELIDTESPTQNRLRETLSICHQFFSRYLKVRLVEMADGSYDLVSNREGIELGSYGLRQHPQVGSWLYATGCAEPRLSTAIGKEST